MANNKWQFPLSASQAEVFKQCPEKWHLIYQENLPLPTSPSLEFGKEIHAVFATVIPELVAGKEEEVVKRGVVEVWGAFREYGRQIWTAAMVWQMVENSWDSLQLLNIQEIISVETKIETPQYRGILDLVFRDAEDKVWVWDWKTTSYSYSLDRIKNQTQLLLYAYLYMQQFNKLPDYLGLGVLHKKTFQCQVLWRYVEENDVTAYLRELGRIGQSIWIDKIRYRDNSRCYDYYTRCPFFDHCWGQSDVGII